MRAVSRIDGNLQGVGDERISFRHTGYLQRNTHLDLVGANQVAVAG